MQRERLTITLEADLLQAIDGLIDKNFLRNRSHAIEHLIKEGLGLHELQQAFLFFDEGWSNEQLERVIHLCALEELRQLFLCPLGSTSRMSEALPGMVSQVIPDYPWQIQVVPSNFGSGGAVVLAKEQLGHSFLLIWLNQDTSIPDRLLSAYLFHHQHGSVLTTLLCSPDAQQFHNCQFAISKPEIIQYIPAGVVSLQESVFPELLKAGKVRGYALPG